MAVNEQLSAYSTNAASNTPLGTETVGPDLDNHLRDMKKNVRAAAQHFLGLTDGNFPGAIKIDNSASPVWTLGLKHAGGTINLFDVDLSAGTTAPYGGTGAAGSFAQTYLPESTASARATILGSLLGLVAGEATTASASHRLAMVGIGPPIGAVQSTIETTAPDGWLPLAGETLGDLSASATYAGGIYEVLYGKLWDNFADAQAAVEGGRGASAAADFAANKYITLPDARGRAVIGVGAGTEDASGSATLTDRSAGVTGGAEETTDVVRHTHDAGEALVRSNGSGSTWTARTSAAGDVATTTAGNVDALSLMQPFIAFNWIIKY